LARLRWRRIPAVDHIAFAYWNRHHFGAGNARVGKRRDVAVGVILQRALVDIHVAKHRRIGSDDDRKAAEENTPYDLHAGSPELASVCSIAESSTSSGCAPESAYLPLKTKNGTPRMPC